MLISFFDVENWENEIYKKSFDEFDDIQLKFFNENIQNANIDEYIESDIISTFIHSKLDNMIISQMPNLKFVTTRSTGYDHIDINSCKERNIAVSNVPFYGENTVAEHTFALILSLSRNIHKTYVRTINNNFSTEGIQGFDLKGKTIGIIGGGQIGMHVAKMAKGFGMNVQVYDIKRNSFLAEILGFVYVSFEDLLKTSDIISLHAPYNKHTHHLINKQNINLIKKGSLLINTARGGLVENDALIEALDKGIISGAGLDVIEGEEYIMEEGYSCNPDQCQDALKLIKQNYSLLHRENVVITPHNAFNSKEAVDRIINTTIMNIKDFIKGNPSNLVNK